MALSGGSTPAPLYRALAERDADWPNIAATLVDERMTPPGAPGSNETFLRTTLLTGSAAAIRFTPLYSAQAPQAAAAAAARALQPLVRPFDVVVLGMGADGHTASFFPYAENLAAALSATAAPVVAVRAQKSAATGDHLDRLTLSLREIVAARRIILLISGAKKRVVFERAAAGEDYPVSTVLRARPDLWACWHP
jgi:6-phosphogluconolactonase